MNKIDFIAPLIVLFLVVAVILPFVLATHSDVIRYKEIRIYQNEHTGAYYVSHIQTYILCFPVWGKLHDSCGSPVRFDTQLEAKNTALLNYELNSPKLKRVWRGSLTKTTK